jgi:hypothetical protein
MNSGSQGIPHRAWLLGSHSQIGTVIMSWELEVDGLKHYPHFDAELSLKRARQIISSASLVAANAFYPFLMYSKNWQPFRLKDPRPDRKERLIRYAARKDAYIFAKYRHELAEKYEGELTSLGISDSVIAYRRVVKSSGGGKCNIDFAAEVFNHIKQMGNCCFIALDISKFFENLDHDFLLNAWCKLLGVTSLPVDHAAVFKAVTNYSFIDRDDLFKRLGFLKERASGEKNMVVRAQRFADLPRKLCSNKEFRQLVKESKTGSPKLIHQNLNTWGIPQGAPISDFLANLYLLEFDKQCHQLASKLGGIYRRYSDDILFVLPISPEKAENVESWTIELIAKQGSKLVIRSSKSSIVEYRVTGTGMTFSHIKGKQGKNGAEYLGFRFDGKYVYLRDSTLANLYRKISKAAKAYVSNVIARYPGKDSATLRKKLSLGRFIASFGRAKDFDPAVSGTWTFRTYALRASKVFGEMGKPILKQLRNMNGISETRLQLAFSRAMESKGP